MTKIFFSGLCLAVAASVCAQSPNAGFTVPANACQQERLALQNTSVSTDTYAWDFCLNDILTPTSTTDVIQPPILNYGFTLKTVWDQGNWYGFVTSVNNNHLIRLDFGNSLTNFPTVVDLGSPGTFFFNPEGFDIKKVGSNWFAFVGHQDFGKGLTRLDFGNSLSNTPSAVYTGDLLPADTRIREVKLLTQGPNLVLIAVDYNNGNIVRVNYGSSFLNSIQPSDVHIDPIPGSNLPIGIDIGKRGGQWIMQAASKANNQIIQLNFGSDIFSAPSVEGTYSFAGLNQPIRLKLFQEGSNFYTIISNETGAIDILDSKDLDPSHPPSEISYASMPALIGLDAFRSDGKSFVYGLGTTDNKLKKVVFESACDANIATSSALNPAGIWYLASGAKKIELIAINSVTGESSVSGGAVSVSANAAPDITFTSQFVCAQSNVNFTSANVSGGISSYIWDFGDAQTSGSANPSHIYSTGGNYNVKLTVAAPNGCTNFSAASLPIYNPPAVNFSLPSIAPVCTSQSYLLANSSVYDPGSAPIWEWRVNGTLVSSQQNLDALFLSPVSQTIKLKAILPGCENEVTKNIPTVVTGPAVSFSSSGKCVGSAISFTNTTTGTVSGYSWSFGDASSSTSVSPSHTYSAPSSYQVTLTASNAAGCNNFQTKSVIVYSVPQPDFATSLPPFSCSNSSTQFQNNTPPLTDSNIISWQWQFGDSASGTSSQQTPAYVYSAPGNYSVSLVATSDAGCSASIVKTATISPGPLADFSTGPSCLNLATKFNDLSSGSIASRNWQIGPAAFTSQSPSYTFTSPGTYNATLTLTSANGCSSVKTKTVTVPVPPVLNFAGANLCAGKDATFTDVTTSPQDVIVGWDWNFDGNSSTGNPAIYNFPSTGTYNVKMTTTHLSGCRYTLQKNLAVNASPLASFTASPDRGEPPLTVKFSNTSQQATAYAWKFYDKVLSTSNSTSPVYTFTSLGDYSAELTATNAAGCSDVVTTPIKVLVPVIDLTLTNFSLVNDPTTAKLKAVVTIANNGNIPVNFVDVALILSDKAVVNETVPVDLSPGSSITKTLSFTITKDANSFLCAEIISEKDVQRGNNKLCVKSDQGDYYFNPYPNPTAGPVQVDWIAGVAGTSRIVIHDNMGRKVFDWQTSSVAGLNRASLDLSLFQTGIYFVTVETGQSKNTSRLVLQ